MFAYLLASLLDLPQWQKIAIVALGIVLIVLLLANLVNLLIIRILKKNRHSDACAVCATVGKIVVNPQWHVVVINGDVATREKPLSATNKKAKEEQAQDCPEQVCELKEECHQSMTNLDEPLSIVDENGEVTELVKSVDYSSGMAIVIRYRKSFTAKLIQCNDEVKEWYGKLKNTFLSYKNVKSRISWDYDSINFNKNQLVKFGVRGKTLCLYLALDPEDYKDTKYKVERYESKKLEELPCLYRIKNARRVSYAIELFEQLAEKFTLEKGEDKKENYYLPYEHNQTLIERNLIKEICCRESFDDFLKKREKGQVAQEESAEPTNPEEGEEQENVDGDIEEVCSINSANGVALLNRYNRAFTTSLLNATPATQIYYNELKNEILSYQWTNGYNMSADMGGDDKFIVAKFALVDGTLEMYIALNAFGHTGEYAVAGENYQTTPCPFYLRDDNDVKDAKDLIADLAHSFDIIQTDDRRNINFLSDCMCQDICSGDTKDNYEEFEIVHYFDEVEKLQRESVTASTADAILQDEIAVSLVEDKRSNKKYEGKKSVVNIDTISSNYSSDEVVSIQSLKEKGIIAENVGYVKVLARGTLDKRLTVEAQDFSPAAVKMIVITGGKAIKV